MGLTKEKAAEMLNGCDNSHEMSKELEAKLKDAGLVVVFGASDDLCEFRGALDEEVGCYGGKIRLSKKGFVDYPVDEYTCADCPLMKKELVNGKTINVIWAQGDYSWTYETDIPHATFDVMEDGEKYCRGIVFHMDDLKC